MSKPTYEELEEKVRLSEYADEQIKKYDVRYAVKSIEGEVHDIKNIVKWTVSIIIGMVLVAVVGSVMQQ